MAVHAFWVGMAAVFSNGFYHPDEFYQTLEFASFKLGITPQDQMMWEFSERIRPWLQPGMYVALARAGHGLGITSPFDLWLVFRVLSGLMGLVGTWLILLGLERRCFTRPYAPTIGWVYAWLWFLPYVYVRTSSESLGGSTMMMALGLCMAAHPPADASEGGPKANPRTHRAGWMFAMGTLLGLAVQFRYQQACMVLGFLAWGLTFGKFPLKSFIWLGLGILGVTALGLATDRWGYGAWTLTPWNYLRVNLLEGRANQFGVDPPWAYMYLIARNPLGPLAWIVLGAAVCFWIRYPRHVLTWSSLPLLIVHSFIGHKEDRFLFPLAMYAPVFLVMGLGPRLMHTLPNRRLSALTQWVWRRRRSPVAKGVYAVNFAALGFVTFINTRPDLAVQAYLYKQVPKGEPVYTLRSSPYNHGYRFAHFTRRKNGPMVEVDGYATLEEMLRISGGLFFTDRNLEIPEEQEVLRTACTMIYRGMPSYMRYVDFNGWVKRVPYYQLYHCQTNP
jgi:phosphatidylinositol glycan class B